jgi:hypothetical protein
LLHWYGRTNQYDVVVELAFVVAFAVHFGHLLESIEHRIHNFLVRQVHARTNFEAISANELILYTAYVGREILHENNRSLTFFARQFIPFDGLYLLLLWRTT